MTPSRKEGRKDSTQNSKPVIVLSTKKFMKEAFKQMPSFFKDIIFKPQCRFSKDFCTQKRILLLWEKQKNSVDKGKIVGTVLTKFSKGYDCLSPDLPIAKLNPDDFNLPALKLVHSYLSNRKQRVQVNDSFILWQDILFGVPQG